MSGRATLATARFRLATAATRISAARTMPWRAARSTPPLRRLLRLAGPSSRQPVDLPLPGPRRVRATSAAAARAWGAQRHGKSAWAGPAHQCHISLAPWFERTHLAGRGRGGRSGPRLPSRCFDGDGARRPGSRPASLSQCTQGKIPIAGPRQRGGGSATPIAGVSAEGRGDAQVVVLGRRAVGTGHRHDDRRAPPGWSTPSCGPRWRATAGSR